MTLVVTLNAVVCYEYCTRNSTAQITSFHCTALSYIINVWRTMLIHHINSP